MKRKNYNILRLMLLMLALMFVVASCTIDDNALAKPTTDDEITVKLSVGSRALGDVLMRNGDDNFSSIAVYAFDSAGGFVALHKFDMADAANAYTVPAFNCGIRTAKIMAIANYKSYADLDRALVKGLAESEVKKLVANADGGTELNSQNIIMVGECGVNFVKPDREDENANVTIRLKRLAARVDVFVFKANDWDDAVELLNVSFNGSVKNTVLNVTETDVYLPKTCVFSSPLLSSPLGNATLLPFENETEQVWRNEEYVQARFYTYRTRQSVDGEHAPRLDIATRTSGVIENTYTAPVAPDGACEARLEAGKVYQVRAVLRKKGIAINTVVADWNDAASYELEFAPPSYDSPITPYGTVLAPPYTQPTVYYSTDGTEGSYSFALHFCGPVGQTWTPTLFGATSFRVEVLQGGVLLSPPYGVSEEVFQLRITPTEQLPASADGSVVERTVSMGIAYSPMWDSSTPSLLLVAGDGGSAWEGSDRVDRVVVRQIDIPAKNGGAKP